MIEGGPTPAGVTDYSPIYGGKPTVPSPVTSAATAVGGNLQNLGQIYQLGHGINTGQQSDLLGNYGAAGLNIPALNATSAGNISNLQHGIIPPDVVNQLIEHAAERGVATGAPGSPNSNAALLSAMGLTSLNLQGMGEQELTAAIGRTPSAPLFNPASMLTTPDEVQQAEMARNIYAAAPVPAAAAENQLMQAHAGLGASSMLPFAPISPTISGGPAFPPVDMGGGGYPNVPVYGATNPTETAPPDYNAWRNMASQWGTTPGQIQDMPAFPMMEPSYTGDEEDYFS